MKAGTLGYGVELGTAIVADTLAEIDEIASMILWLASDECSFSTGAVFDISGGRATY